MCRRNQSIYESAFWGSILNKKSYERWDIPNATISPDLVKAFVLTVRFDGEKAILYTGTSFTTFVADKEPEKLWDEALKQYLFKNEIACEPL